MKDAYPALYDTPLGGVIEGNSILISKETNKIKTEHGEEKKNWTLEHRGYPAEVK